MDLFICLLTFQVHITYVNGPKQILSHNHYACAPFLNACKHFSCLRDLACEHQVNRHKSHAPKFSSHDQAIYILAQFMLNFGLPNLDFIRVSGLALHLAKCTQGRQWARSICNTTVVGICPNYYLHKQNTAVLSTPI